MIEWDIPFTFTTPQGTLELNAATTSPFTSGSDYLFLLDHEACAAGPSPLRIGIDPVPQADGQIIHPAFKPGYSVQLALQFWIEGGSADARTPACDTDRRVMWDTLILHMNSLVNPAVGTTRRLTWFPSGGWDDRMLDGVRLTGWPAEADKGGLATVSLTLATELPYEMDATEQQQYLGGAPPTFITNYGTAPFNPVFRVLSVGGSNSEFAIFNVTTGQTIVYNEALPGGNPIVDGDYVEINTFRNTAYLNGDEANLKAAIDVRSSDFWALVPGVNHLEYFGDFSSTCLMLYNNAWAG